MIKRILAVSLTISMVLVSWSAVAVPKAKKYSPKGYSEDRCGWEPGLKGQASELQEMLLSNQNCIGPMRVASTALTTTKPKNRSGNSGLLDLAACKLEYTPGSQSNAWKGFPSSSLKSNFESDRAPAPGTTLQIIPIYSEDAPAGSTKPAQDYKLYLDLTKKYFESINDGQEKFEILIPDHYIKFPKLIKPYEVRHGKDDDLGRQFIQDAVNAVDSEIDFSKANFHLFVVPAGTDFNVISEQGFPGAQTNEGRINNLAIASPATFKNVFASRNITGLSSIAMWFHEFYHPGMNLGDNHGKNSKLYDEERGMGQFGLMSSGNGDLLTWQKWFLRFTQDSQVRCVSKDAASISWIVPSSAKSTKSKLVVVPLSSTKAIVVESIRAMGLSYRYPKESLGALTYLVDMTDTRHDYGYLVFYPDNRRPTGYERYAMSAAPLKLGETLTYEGVKITNVEWGEFGDVIKVEPATK